MKVKLKGDLFKHPMEYNHITIHNNVIEVHNCNDDISIGHLKKYENPVIVPEMIELTLNKKDCTLLSTMDEFNIEKKEGVIHVIGDHIKAKFADMLKTLPKPNTDNMVTLNVDFRDLELGKAFAGVGDGARPQYGGITIHNDRIISSDSYCIFQKDIQCDDGIEINIPKEIFKYLKNENYTIKTNSKIVVFETEKGGAFYSNLISVLLSTNKIDDSGDITMQVNKNEILDKLKIIKDYSPKLCRLSAKGDTLALSDDMENNQITLYQDIVTQNLGSLIISVNTSQLIKMISMVSDDDIVLKFTKIMVKVIYQDIVAASTRVGNEVEVIPS